MEKSSVVEIGKQCLRDEAEAILAMLDHVDEHFEKAVDLICNCKGKVIVTGVGKSGHIGSKIAATLASTGTPAFFLNPLDAYHGDLGMLSEDDIVLAISYSGATEELLRFLPLIQAKKIRIIGISGNDESLLARCSDIHLNVAVAHEADPLNLIPTASTTATLALGDALACALVEAKHFQPTDFAKLHPGGDLGRKLLAKVEDVMFTENLPFVGPEMPLSEAIEIVTKGTLGIGIVVENEALVGIITDGDIRRAMMRLGQDFFATKVSAIMSKNPKTISCHAKIVEAGEKMNHHSIHTLIVLDDASRVCGVIDSFSCLPGTRFYH
ncbi:MAG: KpsF/GutQ family sugar-phosphate isomerase [Paludibacteraceae bacterium]|nr:KpsF/GutQ family sugar-phosphate isomerase [Paludibacteraceae bacterium]MBQ6985063.1 KpsF/GutQ family sugar-phosphate isomerase [Paludibacteraceae bacterium]